MKRDLGLRLWLLAIVVFVTDQLSKLVVLRTLDYAHERVVLDGFFKLVHWGNTGAAWSLFNRVHGSNELLAIVSLIAFGVLYFSRRHFDAHTPRGQIALGLIFGGIAGNLWDRFARQHVVDFLYFYINPRGGGEIGFPAFNVADSAICTGVGLLFLFSWRQEVVPAKPTPPSAIP